MKSKETRKKIIGVFIFVFIFILTLISTFYFSAFFEVSEVQIFITVSSWLLSIFSFVFIFIVWDKFTYSSYKKIKRQKEYLNDEGVKDLDEAVTNILNFFSHKDESVDLFESCSKVKKISDLLMNTREDCELLAYKKGITDFSSLLNKKNIKKIKNYEDEKLKRLSEKDLDKILNKSFTLKEDLKMILKK